MGSPLGLGPRVHRITETLKLENTSQITWSNRPPTPCHPLNHAGSPHREFEAASGAAGRFPVANAVLTSFPPLGFL